MIICRICEKPKRLVARGLCNTCYHRAWSRGLLAAFPRYTPKYTDRHAYWRAYYQAHRAEKQAYYRQRRAA